MRPAVAAVALAVTAALAAAACSAPQRPRGTRVVAAYRFRCEPRDARVILDEVDQGACVLWEGRYLGVGAGAHRLRIEREGYLPVERDLGPSREGRRQTVDVRLRVVPE